MRCSGKHTSSDIFQIHTPTILSKLTKSDDTSFVPVMHRLKYPRSILTFLVGQIYHTLLQEREERGIADVAISRLEQLSPFPYDLVCDIHWCLQTRILCGAQLTPHLDTYPNASLLWCQVRKSYGAVHTFFIYCNRRSH
jgi:hypothetical protein